MAFDINGGTRLLIGGTETEESGDLLRIIEVSESSRADDECGGKAGTNALDGREGFHLPVILGLGKVGEFPFELANQLLQGLYDLKDGALAGRIYHRQDFQ